MRFKSIVAAIGLTVAICCSPLYARGRLNGIVQRCGQTIVTNGIASSTKSCISYPGASVTVYYGGTSNPAIIYSDASGTIKSPTFSALGDASWFFYAENGDYDIQFSGGGIPIPFMDVGRRIPSATAAATNLIDVKNDFGAKLDWRVVSDAAITSGLATLTSVTANFTSADVAKIVVVRNAGTANPTASWFGDTNYPLITTIASVTNPTTAVVTLAASNTVSGQPAVWASDDSGAINSALASCYTNGGGSGSGYCTVLIPGVAFTNSTVTIDATYAKVRLIGTSWMHSGIVHIGAASNGCLRLTGPTVPIGTAALAVNANWFEVKDLTLYSFNGNTMTIDASLNSRFDHLWLANAGPSAGTAAMRITKSGIMEMNNTRIGGGDVGGGVSSFGPWSAIPNFVFPHAIYATNDSGSFFGELHFMNVQEHGVTSDHGVRLETGTSPQAASFDNTFTDCEIAENSNAGSTKAAFSFDGVQAVMTNVHIEQRGTPPYPYAVRLKSTTTNTNVRMMGVVSQDGGLLFDLSGAASPVGISALVGFCQFNQIDSTGANSAVVAEGSHNRFQVDNSAAALAAIDFRGMENRIGLGTAAVEGGPSFSYGGGATSQTGTFLLSNTSANPNVLAIQKSRGTPNVKAAIQGGDSVGRLTFAGYVNGAMQAGGQISVDATAVSATDITGKMTTTIRDGTNGLQNAMILGPYTLQPPVITFAAFGAQLTANGMLAYCANCDPPANPPVACTSAGAQTGAIVTRINGVNICHY